MLGVAFGLMAATCWGFSAILVRLGLQHLRPTTGTWTSLVPGGILVMSLAVVFNLDDITTLAAIAFFWFALGGLFAFALGRFLNAVSIQKAGVARATPLFSTAPLFATILAIIFLGETITLWLLLGTVTIVTGIILITSEQLR
ncbi:MAG: DMT family transporter [Dehalococcoidia bacterium]|nr:DMT family transporter [Dehalococcoidia bacterium]